MTTYYERNKEKIRARVKARHNALYHSDETYRLQFLERGKQWREKNKEKHEATRQAWLERTPGYTMYHNARRRAIELSLPFNIHYSDITIPTHCPVLGIELNTGDREHAASLDRKIPELGYVQGNIAVISIRANRLKNDAKLHELKAIVSYLET